MAESNGVAPIVGSPEPLARIRVAYPSLSKTEKQVARFVLDHPDEVIHAPITTLAERLEISEATIVRFCQRLGYRGYPSFRIFLARDLGRPFEDAYQVIERSDDFAGIARQVFDLSVQALADTLAALEPAALDRAARALAAAGRIYLYGVGGSGETARIAHHKLLRARIPCEVCTDPHLQTFVASTTQAGDAAIGISYSGGSDDVTRALNISRQRGATTIALVSLARSPVAKAADIVLLGGGGEEPQFSEPGTCRLVQIALLDALCACITTQRGGA